MCECDEVCLKDIEDRCLECCMNMGCPEEIYVPEDSIVMCMKVEENHTDSLPIGYTCELLEGLIPPGFKPIEEVEFFMVSDDTPPEVSFWDTLNALFGKRS